MKINRENYEVYFLDYLEGKLPPDLVDELLMFMDKNPDLKDEFEGLDTVALAPDQGIVFEDKNSLKKNGITSVGAINGTNYEHFFIAKHEGDLSTDESLLVERFLQKNPSLKKDYDLFGKTKLQPDTSIAFDRKQSLKKFTIGAISRTALYRISSLAATLLILFGLYLLINQDKPSYKPENKLMAYRTAKPAKPVKATKVIKKQKPQYPRTKSTTFKITNITSHRGMLAKAETKPATETSVPEENSGRMMLASTQPMNSLANQMFVLEKDFDDPDFEYRNYYTALYYDILMAEQIEYAQSLAAQEQRPNSPLEWAHLQIKKLLSNKDPEDQKYSDKINLWDVADTGIKGFNKLIKKDFKVSRTTNDEGKTTGYDINGVDYKLPFSKQK